MLPLSPPRSARGEGVHGHRSVSRGQRFWRASRLDRVSHIFEEISAFYERRVSRFPEHLVAYFRYCFLELRYMIKWIFEGFLLFFEGFLLFLKNLDL